MERSRETPSVGEVMSELGAWMVGGGILTMMLFPFAVPILLLTAVALVPLLVPVVVLGILALPVLGVRAAVRAVRRTRDRRKDSDSASARPAWDAAVAARPLRQ
jgi:uncharacterized membrane protein YhaH (DUF805 family)